MLSGRDVVATLGLNPNTKSAAAFNKAVRLCTPGGNELLDTLERLDYARLNSGNHPHFAAEVGKLREERDQRIRNIREGLVPLRVITPVR